MEEYISPIASQQSLSRVDSTSDTGEIETVCSLSANIQQRSGLLKNHFNASCQNQNTYNLSPFTNMKIRILESPRAQFLCSASNSLSLSLSMYIYIYIYIIFYVFVFTP